MSEYYPEPSPEDKKMYGQFELARESLVEAFAWAMGEPHTADDGQWNTLDEAEKEVVIFELINGLYEYAHNKLRFPIDFVDDCLTDAIDEQNTTISTLDI